jgi:hypothetical protein
MGNNSFAPYKSPNTYFIVKNVSPQNKKISIFNYPILMNQTRDLLLIPGVGEGDIRDSLLKGELYHKLLFKDIVIEKSSVNLLQFDPNQLQFLVNSGISYGLRADIYNLTYLYQADVELIGTVNGINNIFYLPQTAVYLQNSPFFIIVYWNGVKQNMGDDFYVSESYGPGTGYNIVVLAVPPSFGDIITADYYTLNS